MTIKADISSKLEKFTADFSFESNSDRIGILGESGAGKSMLLKFLAGIYNPDRAEIWLDGRCLHSTKNNINIIPQDRNIAYMFQNYALFPTMSVRNNIEIVVKGDKKTKKEKADFLLKKFHIEELAGRKPGELSGGQQQRVALARVLAYEPSLILLDEPFSALDQGLKEKLQIELENMLQDYGGKVIMVSHSIDELYKFSKELIVVSDGCIVETGTKDKLFHRPDTIKAARLLGVNNILSAKICDRNQIEIPEWNCKIHTDRKIPKKVRAIGIRDTEFCPVWAEDDTGENVIDIEITDLYETLNHVKIFFTIPGGEAGKKKFTVVLDRIDFEDRGLPKKLKLNPQKIIFFEENPK